MWWPKTTTGGSKGTWKRPQTNRACELLRVPAARRETELLVSFLPAVHSRETPIGGGGEGAGAGQWPCVAGTLSRPRQQTGGAKPRSFQGTASLAGGGCCRLRPAACRTVCR